jgi:hypothetical protein
MSCIPVIFEIIQKMISGHFGNGLLVGVPSACYPIMWQGLMAMIIGLSLVLFWRR